MSRKNKRYPMPHRPRLDLPVEELTAIIQRAEVGPISAAESAKLKALVETFALLRAELQSKQTSVERLQRMLFGASTEKTHTVLGKAPLSSSEKSLEDPARSENEREGHGRNAAAAYTGASKVQIDHPSLHGGDACPGCHGGTVYLMGEPAKLVRVRAMAPLQATVYECTRLRCGLCGEVYTAAAPQGVGQQKYDASCGAMVGLLRYGAGLPFNRVEKLQGGLGIPLPTSTQWDLSRDSADTLSPGHEELIRQAAQGNLVHNDDTTMRILKLTPEQRAAALGPEAGESRTGVFTSGIVSGYRVENSQAYFTGAVLGPCGRQS